MPKTSDPRPGPARALLISQIFYPEMISTGQVLTELAEALADLGVELEVWCGPPTLVDRTCRVPRRLDYRGIAVRRVRGTRLPKIRLWGKVLNQLSYLVGVSVLWLCDRSRRPALVTTDPPYLPILCALLTAVRGRPLVCLVLDVYPDTAVRQGLLAARGLTASIWSALLRTALRRSTKIVALGRRMASILADKDAGSGALAAKIEIIPLWADERRLRPPAAARRPRTPAPFTLLYAGNMGRVHDMETVMRAAEATASEDAIRFRFVGEGHQKEWMEAFARRRDLANCRFETYVPREELGDLLASADAGLVSMNRGQEGLSEPCKTLGIMAAGRPVVGVLPRESEMAGIIREHRCGFVVEPGDVPGLVQAVRTLARNPRLCAAFGRRGRATVVRRYRLATAAERYLGLLAPLQPGFPRGV